MADNENHTSNPTPGPDPALKRLERFVGSWGDLMSRMLDSDEDNVTGRTTFEWLPGGYFLQQRIELDFAGYKVKGPEVIGYDPATDRFLSTVFSSMVGVPIPYEYNVQGDTSRSGRNSTADAGVSEVDRGRHQQLPLDEGRCAVADG